MEENYAMSENLDVLEKEGKPAEGEEPRSHVIVGQVARLAGKRASYDYPE
jgi:hypothetical protein